MLSLLKSLGILWPVYGPPAGSEKQPKYVKPSVVVAVLEEEVREVVVLRVVVGEVVDADEEVVPGMVELLLLLEDEATDDEDVLLVGEVLEDDEVVLNNELVEGLKDVMLVDTDLDVKVLSANLEYADPEVDNSALELSVADEEAEMDV